MKLKNLLETSKTEKKTEISKPERRCDIDWLRVLAIIVMLLFHCARFFNYEDWHVKNNQLSLGMSVFISFLVLWLMPVFLVLSGLSSYYSLSYSTGGQYILARVKRLLIPLIFGTFVLIPPQVYIERVSHSQFTGSFIKFYPHYFDGLYGFGGNFAWMGLHLWYLEFLFVFSLLTLPFFLLLKRKATRGSASRLAALFGRPGAIFLLVIPLAIVEMLVGLQPDGIGMRAFGGWSPITYLVFFIYGYFMASDPQYKLAIERNRMIALAVGIVASAVLISVEYSPSHFRWIEKITGSIEFFRALISWSWLVAILGFGSRYLNFSNRMLRYANEGVLPFYILHQSVIVTIGFYIAGWNTSLLLKYLVIITSSFTVIAILYELLIRRVNLFRFLFGLKLKKR